MDRPLVIAHRTLPRDEPENSLAGIARAVRVADAVEVDARRARDGVPVLLHDPLLLRTKYVPLHVRWVPSRWLARLRVPTLAEGLAALGPATLIAIDTKDPGAGPAVLDAVRAAGVEDRALLWAQSTQAVRAWVAGGAARERIALLRDTATPEETTRYLDDAVAVGAGAVSVHEDVWGPAVLDAARERDLRVFCWFQSVATLERGPLDGLAGIVTDWPERAVELLSR